MPPDGRLTIHAAHLSPPPARVPSGSEVARRRRLGNKLVARRPSVKGEGHKMRDGLWEFMASGRQPPKIPRYLVPKLRLGIYEREALLRRPGSGASAPAA